MKQMVISIIAKCAICGSTREMLPERYPYIVHDEAHQISITLREAMNEFNSNKILATHRCNLDRVIGYFQFAGIKFHGVEE